MIARFAGASSSQAIEQVLLIGSARDSYSAKRVYSVNIVQLEQNRALDEKSGLRAFRGGGSRLVYEEWAGREIVVESTTVD
jgi:hypothetical protein